MGADPTIQSMLVARNASPEHRPKRSVVLTGLSPAWGSAMAVAGLVGRALDSSAEFIAGAIAAIAPGLSQPRGCARTERCQQPISHCGSRRAITPLDASVSK